MRIYIADNAWKTTIKWTGSKVRHVLFPFTHKEQLKVIQKLNKTK